jgi:hypothetical protein
MQDFRSLARFLTALAPLVAQPNSRNSPNSPMLHEW